MTSRSRRKPRTTAPRTWGPATACRLALLAGLIGGTAAAQPPAPPGYRPAAVYGSPYPTTAGQPGGGFNRPGMPVQPHAQTQPRQQPTGTTGRPDTGPPAGYRPVGSSAQPASRGASAGHVMYFRKPANALAADGMADAGAVAQVSAPPVLAPVATDAPVGAVVVPPAVPTVTEQPIPTAAPVPLGLPAPVFTSEPVFQEVAQQPAPAVQPKTTVSQKEVVPLPPEVTQLPGRDKIFMMYDDETLRRAIIEQAKKNKVGGTIDFPALPPVVPPGTQYVSRTGTQPPLRAVYESGFVVHRRLHFEEKNSERYGWDLGLASPIVSTAAFYRDVLLWPHSLASGLTHGMWDTSAGKCLPGSPVPYYWYPPGLTISGTTAEALVVTGAAFVIP